MKRWIAVTLVITALLPGLWMREAGGAERPVITLRGELAHLSIDLAGGGIVDFHLLSNGINPLKWEGEGGELEPRNRGHFLTAGPPLPRRGTACSWATSGRPLSTLGSERGGTSATAVLSPGVLSLALRVQVHPSTSSWKRDASSAAPSSTISMQARRLVDRMSLSSSKYQTTLRALSELTTMVRR